MKNIFLLMVFSLISIVSISCAENSKQQIQLNQPSEDVKDSKSSDFSNSNDASSESKLERKVWKLIAISSGSEEKQDYLDEMLIEFTNGSYIQTINDIQGYSYEKGTYTKTSANSLHLKISDQGGPNQQEPQNEYIILYSIEDNRLTIQNQNVFMNYEIKEGHEGLLK